MLAHDGANHEKKIQGVKLLEPKLDGVRCLTVVDFESRTVTQYTRNGKVLENFSHITEALKSQLDFFGRSYVLDGEVVSSSFQNLMTQVHRKSDVQAQDARLMLFDIVPLSEFKQGRSITGQRRRSALLRSLRSAFAATGCVELVSQVEVDLDTMIGQAQFKEFNQQAIIDNYEGIMIKDPNAAYECKRSASWLKMKPFIEVSLTINTVEEGTGRNLGKLGALVCSGNDDGRMIDVNVGSGFTDEQRAEFWEDREVLVNQVVEVRADAVTQNQDGSYSLRFPRFLRFRGFAAGEKI
jgi:DNA ligase-1